MNLKPRDIKLAELITKGLSRQGIASVLNIKEGAVQHRITRLLKKTSFKNTKDLAIYFLKQEIEKQSAKIAELQINLGSTKILLQKAWNANITVLPSGEGKKTK